MGIDLPTVRINDLGLAAALVSCGIEMQTTERDADGRAHFVFLQTVELDHNIDDYWSDTLNVKARKLIDNTKMLKSRIYSKQ